MSFCRYRGGVGQTYLVALPDCHHSRQNQLHQRGIHAHRRGKQQRRVMDLFDSLQKHFTNLHVKEASAIHILISRPANHL